MALSIADARADGGTLRFWERRDDFEIAVFTSPSPFTVGPVDISVLVLDPTSGEPVSDANVLVKIAPLGRSFRPSDTHPASPGAASNKLFYAAMFEVDDPGVCAVEVSVEGVKGKAIVRFHADVGDNFLSGMPLWPWIVWPALVVVVYGAHQGLVWRKQRPKIARSIIL